MAYHGNHAAASTGDDADLPETTLHEEKEFNSRAGELELDPRTPVAFEPNSYAHSTQIPAQDLSRRRPIWKKKRIWLPLAAVLLLAALIGGLVGGLTNRHDTSDKSAATTSDAPASVASPDTLNSSLASVAWTDQENVAYRRLYYQDSAGTVKESAWNSSGNAWYSSNEAVGTARRGSPLAAAVVGPKRLEFQINLYCVDQTGRILELLTNDGQLWSSGSISAQGITPAANSDLAAVYTQYDEADCEECDEVTRILAYEGGNQKLQVVNATSSGSPRRQLDADIISGSGLAINLGWKKDGAMNLRLYYQNDQPGARSLDWEPADGNNPHNKNEDWTLHENPSPEDPGSIRAPLASFSWGRDEENGYPLLLDTLISGPSGVTVQYWTPQGFGEKDLEPPVFKDMDPYSPITATGDRHIYALKGGSVQEYTVSDNGLEWSLVGQVPTMS
ncbi:MAG: hypothetical protein Q9169_007010 [Polycauliona sp. 2 TL-2023]